MKYFFSVCALGFTFFLSAQEPAASSLFPQEQSQPQHDTAIVNCIDPHQAEWQKLEATKNQGAFFEYVCAAIIYFKKRFDELEETQKNVISYNQELQQENTSLQERLTAIEKKQQTDIERQDAGIKQLNQLFSQENRYAGG